jgi:hypothetical protein
MQRPRDLDIALRFVIRRIEEEATRSGAPLSDEQRFLLNHVAKHGGLQHAHAAEPEFPAVLVPRDTTYARLCTLAEAAHQHDLQRNRASIPAWEFAAAVSRLNRHPMSCLLKRANVEEPRPWWNQWLRFVAALLFLFSVAAVMLLAGIEPWTRFEWAGIGAGYIAILVVVHLASRRIEEWQLKQTIERCRRDPSSSLAGEQRLPTTAPQPRS